MELYHYNLNHDKLGRFAESNTTVKRTLNADRFKREMQLADLTASTIVPGYDFVKDILKDSIKETMKILKEDFKNFQNDGASFIREALEESAARKNKKTAKEQKPKSDEKGKKSLFRKR